MINWIKRLFSGPRQSGYSGKPARDHGRSWPVNVETTDLVRRRIAARQRIKQAGGHTFTLRRPTEFEKVKFASLTMLEYLCQCIDDCDLSEADLFAGGSADMKVPFERGLLFDWMQEKPELWKPLMDELGDLVKAHETALGEAAKN